MSALNVAEKRASAAVDRLEAALRALAAGSRPADPQAALERADLERDRDGLKAECERLRHELAAANERGERLAAAVDEADERLDEAISRIDEIAGD